MADELNTIEFSDLSVRQRVEAFYRGTDALALFAERRLIPVLRGQLSMTKKEGAVVGTYYRMYAWMKSLVAMNGPIHFQGVAAAARALFELLLDLTLLSRDSTGDFVDKYRAYPQVEKFRVAKMTKSFLADKPDSPLNETTQARMELLQRPGEKDRIEGIVRALWGVDKKGKLKWPDHWSGLNRREIAKGLGDKYEGLYVQAYPLTSWSVHGGSTNYACLDEKAIEMWCGYAYGIAQDVFLEAIITCARQFHLDKAIEGFHEILADLNAVPANVLAEEQIAAIKAAAETSSSE